MAVLPIVRLGHPVLRDVAQPVPAATLAAAAFQELISDLVDTMRAAHGVGLAAPQVGLPWQVFVYEVAPRGAAPPSAAVAAAGGAADEGAADEGPADEGPADEGAADVDAVPELALPRLPVIPLHVLVNPMLAPQAGELVYDWEGCLSIPDLRGLVPRHPAVRVRALDRHGAPLDYLAAAFEARIIQHEFDHLNGVVFLDRMRDLRALAFRDEWEQYMAEPGEEAPEAIATPATAASGATGAAD